MNDKIELQINGRAATAVRGERLLDVLKAAGVFVPTLCEHPALPPVGSCRLCLVEVMEGRRSRLVASCLYPVEGPLEVMTESPCVQKARRFILTLLLARYPSVSAVTELAQRYGVSSRVRLKDEAADCLLCLRCVRACAAEGTGAIATCFRGREKKVDSPFAEPPESCIGCGACAAVCPTGAIKLEESAGRRRIWGREFTLVRCRRCGEPFATREQLDWAGKELSGPLLELELCPRCRQIDEAARLGGVERE